MDTTFATICSMLPYTLVESKPGLNPNEYTIEKAKDKGFELTIIPNNVFYLINPDPLSDAKEVRNIKVPVLAMEIGQAIITDYNNSLLGVNQPDAVPGLFCVRGDWTDKKEFAKSHITEMMVYREAQNRWFQNLVSIADDTWAKTRSPMGIGDLQRDACRMLGYARDWMNPLPSEQIEKCPMCKSPINLGAVKCMACQYILDKKRHDELVGAK